MALTPSPAARLALLAAALVLPLTGAPAAATAQAAPVQQASEVSETNQIIQLTDASFDSEVLNSPKLVLVYFSMKSCPPCKTVDAALSEIADEYEGKFTIGRLDIQENPETTYKYEVTGVPTLKFFKDGKVIGSKTGFAHQNEVKDFVHKYVQH